jgi:hypothetical protein
MRRIHVPAGIWAITVIALLVGLGLLALAQWSRPLLAAHQAVGQNLPDQALELFGQAESRFDKVPAAKQLLPKAYDGSVSNQLAMDYRLQQYDVLLEKASTSPPVAATHFWAGCALLAKGNVEEQPEARVGWLTRAEQEFKSALALEPDDWDTKYNLELTHRLLAALRKEPKTPPKQMLKLLRPQPKSSVEPTRRVG